MRRLLTFLVTSLAVLLAGYALFAAISLSTSVTYTQNFDGMGIPATATTPSTLPTDFRADATPTSTSTDVRKVGTFSAAGATTARAGGANLSTSAGNGIYNFGSGTATLGGSDRAVGFLASGTATASGNLYTQLTNNTGAAITRLQIVYNVEKYRKGSNANGFRIQLFSSPDGSTWTTAGSAFLTSFPADADNTGFATAPGVTVHVDQTLPVTIASGNNFFLAWNYSVSAGTTVTSAQALAIDDISILGLTNNPGGIGTAAPSTVAAGGSTLLTVETLPGANPATTVSSVRADLSAIGGSVSQPFFDDGTHGDAVAGDNVYSFLASVPADAPSGTKNIQATITDSQSRTGTAAFALIVPAPTPPTGVGTANPNAVQAGNSTLLTVGVTPGTSPTSTGLAVTADLSSIGGSMSQAFFDDGTHGDAVAGDKTFSFQATVPTNTLTGGKTIPATITDAQTRTGSASISLTVTAASTAPTGAGSADPSSGLPGNSTLLTVNVTPGSNPTSTGLSVVVNLSSIGGASSQQFYDDGTHGDATAGDKIFSFQALVPAATAPGTKSLSATVSDAQARSSTTSISLTVLSPPPPTTIKISQVYGGGGNSGATYTNDFIEIFNQGPDPINVTNWSVQYSSATTSTWTATALCGSGQTCVIAPGHYYLVQESQGAGGTTGLPTADVIVAAADAVLMSATQGKVALVASTTLLTGACPTGGSLVDLIGYGAANCSETSPTPALNNTSAAVRKGNGCIDTGNNANAFVVIGPIPRNSAAPANSCGGDPAQPSGLGTASPSSVDPASHTLLTVRVTPATAPPSTGVTVAADLTSIGGSASQTFYDDGTHGDQTAGDNVFSFQATVGPFTSTGAKYIVATLRDAQGRVATSPLTLTVQSPTCGVERWSVKVGADPDAGQVMLNNVVRQTIVGLGQFPAPPDPPGPPDDARVAPYETAVYVVNATMTVYKKETDVDYHIVLQDEHGNTLIAEIPSPACIITTNPPGVTGPRLPAASPFSSGIANARTQFDARFTVATTFQFANVPVQVTGVGFFDFIHGQTGVAQNGIELHPVLDISFTANTSTTLASSANPSQFGQPASLTATVSSGSGVPTGKVYFFEGSNPNAIGEATLDQNGQATYTTSSLSVGGHSITASYEGDHAFAQSTSALFTQAVDKADQTISFAPLAGKTYGDPDFAVTATASSGLKVTFSVLGPATISDDVVHITGAGTITVIASQGDDEDYNAAADADQSFDVAQATQTITFAPLQDKVFGAPPFTVSATGGGSGNAVTFGAAGSCFVTGSLVTITGAGSCTVTASQLGDANYKPAPTVSRSFTINQAAATITVNGGTFEYDGQPHGATATATGVFGEDLTSLLNVGASFTDMPGGTATWTFTGNINYAPASGTVAITIRDTIPPSIDSVTPSVTSIWPPNKRMVPVSVEVTAADAPNPNAPACTVSGVASNEAASGQWTISAPLTVDLLADRNGAGDGRIYTITITCTDASGHSTAATATVIVPHDERP
jgi:Big-like domain-containing protein/lamin tail-like protein